MKSQKNILIAFILNLSFSIFEFIGGIFTGSFAIASDSLHDLGDAAGIGLSYFMEKKSNRQPDDKYTYGYRRYSVMGSIITTFILLAGSVAIIYNSILRILSPVEINYNGMIILAIIGTIVNLAAAFFTKDGESLNQKAVNLHMLEDVLGWVVVLIGAIAMKFTDISIIDPILSILVSVFVLINALKNLKEAIDILLVKTPDGLDVSEIRTHLCHIEGVEDVHHIHLWSMDNTENYATMHIVSSADSVTIKKLVRDELAEHGITHTTLEFETPDENCKDKACKVNTEHKPAHHHHHHHH